MSSDSQVYPHPLPPALRELADLFNGTSPHSFQFKTNICQYNAAFAFTSLGVTVDQSVTAGSGSYSFRISGELHHLSGALLPLDGNQPVFAQIHSFYTKVSSSSYYQYVIGCARAHPIAAYGT